MTVLKMSIVVVVGFVVFALAGAACEDGDARGAPQSRWTPIEAPRADLECWSTNLAGGAIVHVECWPKVEAK
jgi:hypothetical protein